MSKIEIEVNQKNLDRWNKLPESAQKRIAETIEKLIESLQEDSDDFFWNTLNKIRAKAEERGFDDEVLKQILSER